VPRPDTTVGRLVGWLGRLGSTRSVRIVLPVHQGASRGVGTIVRGLRASLPAALGPDDELVVVGTRVQESEHRRLQGRPGSALMSVRLSRLLYEQLFLPVAARGADLVHLCDHRPLLLSRQRFLLTVHDVFFLDHPEWFSPATVRYRRAMLSAAIRKQPAAVVCVSHYTRERFLAHYPQAESSHVVVIHPGIEPANPGEGAEPESDPYFLTVAMIEPRKNHLGLLQAFKLARAHGLELRWKVVGATGQCSDEIVEALSFEPGVDVLGHVPDDQLDRLYRGALFHALPSHAEGFGFPPLEAMARGIPTVCSTGSALDETIGEAALRIPPEDRGRWAEALQLLASDGEERARLRALGQRRAASLPLGQAARAYVSAYRKALEGPS
jgi:glycosyltransferase involved in cell wall biosynthesis